MLSTIIISVAFAAAILLLDVREFRRRAKLTPKERKREEEESDLYW